MALLPDLIPAGTVELRRWRPAQAEALTAAVEASLPELGRWMPWAQEHPTVDGITEVLTEGEASFEADREWQFVVAEPGADGVLGAHRPPPPRPTGHRRDRLLDPFRPDRWRAGNGRRPGPHQRRLRPPRLRQCG